MAGKKTQAFAPDADFGAILEWMAKYSSWETVAERMGVSRSTAWRWAQGKLTPRPAARATMLKLAAETAQVHGSIPDPVRIEFEKAGVEVRDRVAQVIYV